MSCFESFLYWRTLLTSICLPSDKSWTNSQWSASFEDLSCSRRWCRWKLESRVHPWYVRESGWSTMAPCLSWSISFWSFDLCLLPELRANILPNFEMEALGGNCPGCDDEGSATFIFFMVDHQCWQKAVTVLSRCEQFLLNSLVLFWMRDKVYICGWPIASCPLEERFS